MASTSANYTVVDVAFDGSSVEIRFGSKTFGLTKCGFGDALESEFVTRIGSQQQDAETEGSYKTDPVAVTMEVGEWRRFERYLPTNGYGRVRFPIHILRKHPDLGSYPIDIENCRIKGNKESIEATNKAGMVELTLSCSQIKRNGKTINRLRGSSASPNEPSKL